MSMIPRQSSSAECWLEDSATVIFGDDLVEDFSVPSAAPAPPSGSRSAYPPPPAFGFASQPPLDSLRPYIDSAPAVSRSQSSPRPVQADSATSPRGGVIRGLTWGVVLSSAAFFAGAFFYPVSSTERAQMAVPVVLDADALGPVPQPSLIELAARGEPEALTEIKNKEPSSREPVEVAALFDGEEARSREKASKAVLALAKKRSFTPEDEAEFFRHVGDGRTFREALVAMATNESEAGPDLIYSTARRFRLQRDVHDFAMALLMTPSVSQYASPALSVIIDAETTTSCRDAKKLVDRVYEDGDVRAVRHMAKFAETVGCGKMGNEDCYPCLRDDRALVDALRAAHARSAPH